MSDYNKTANGDKAVNTDKIANANNTASADRTPNGDNNTNAFYVPLIRNDSGCAIIKNGDKDYGIVTSSKKTIYVYDEEVKSYAEKEITTDIRCRFNEEGIYIPIVMPTSGLVGYLKLDRECVKGFMEMLKNEDSEKDESRGK